MNFNHSISLDKYLTTPNDNAFLDYYDSVIERFEDDYFDVFFESNKDLVDIWIDKLYYKEIDSLKAFKIIQRTIKLYML